MLPTSTRSTARRSDSVNTYQKFPTGYYVYAYIRKDGTPYYIGKGKGRRAWAEHTVSIPDEPCRIVILEQNLTDIGALAIERRMIEWYGRKDIQTGILHNRTGGGNGSKNRPTSDETKQKISYAKTGKKRTDITWNKGLKYSEELKNKLDTSGLSQGHGWNKGQKLTDEHRANLKKAWERRKLKAINT